MRLALCILGVLPLAGCSDASLPTVPPGSWHVAPMTPVAAIPPMTCPAKHYPDTLYNREADVRLLVLLSHGATLLKLAVPGNSGVQLCVPDATTTWEWRVRV